VGSFHRAAAANGFPASLLTDIGRSVGWLVVGWWWGVLKTPSPRETRASQGSTHRLRGVVPTASLRRFPARQLVATWRASRLVVAERDTDSIVAVPRLVLRDHDCSVVRREHQIRLEHEVAKRLRVRPSPSSMRWPRGAFSPRARRRSACTREEDAGRARVDRVGGGDDRGIPGRRNTTRVVPAGKLEDAPSRG
jgi:hypothetical protein